MSLEDVYSRVTLAHHQTTVNCIRWANRSAGRRSARNAWNAFAALSCLCWKQHQKRFALTRQLGINGEEDIKEGVWRKRGEKKQNRRAEERQVKGVLEKWECGEVGRRWSQYLKMDPTERKQRRKKAPPSLLQPSGAVRKFPYRYFMERKSFDAPSPLWSEVRWGGEKKKERGESRDEGERKKEGEAGSGYFYVMEF